MKSNQVKEVESSNRLYTRQEAQEALRIGATKYWALIKDGRLEVVRLGRRTTRVTGRSVAALLGGAA